MSEEGTSLGEAMDGVTRRQFLAGGGATLATVGGSRALYNTVLGYGELGMGTNLLEQDLAAAVSERLRPRVDERMGDVRVRTDAGDLVVEADDTHRLDLRADDLVDAEAVAADVGLEEWLPGLFVDASAIVRGAYEFEFHQPDAFFQRVDGSTTRSGTVEALRNRWDRAVDPETVGTFAGADPADPAGLIHGLVEGFRAHAYYDVPRYVAGSVEDNVVFGAADLRRHFEADVDFESLLEADGTGIFCWELVYRSVEALQAVPPDDQTVPVAACYVSDRRHKHAFTGVATAVREDDRLTIPMTFVDYTDTTMYDDLRLTGVAGEGLAAYDASHRADDVYW